MSTTLDRSHVSASTFATCAIVLVLLVGTAIRAGLFLSPHSLWSDEAAVAINLLDRGYLQLFGQLDGEQHAPIAFLLLSKLSCELFGYNEQSFWLVAMISGTALPFVIWRLLQQTCTQAGTIAGVAIVSLSPTLIRYSCELKPYILDALTTSVILLWTLPRIGANEGGRRPLYARVATNVVRALASSVLILASFPAVFCLAGLSICEVIGALRRKHAIGVANCVLTALPYSFTFLVYYFLLLSKTSQSEFLQGFWAGAFLTIPTSPYLLAANLRLLVVPFSDSLGIDFRLAALLSVCGILGGLVACRREALWKLISILAVAAVASLLHKWPFNLRLMLFAAPIALIIMAWAVEFMCRTKGLRVAFLVVAAILVGPLMETNELVDTVGVPYGMRHTSGILRSEYDRNDVVYVYYLVQPEVELYRRLGVFPEIPTIASPFLISAPWIDCEQQLDGLPADSRIWVVFGNLRVKPFDERQAIRFHLMRHRFEVRSVADYLSLFGPERQMERPIQQ